VEFLYFIMKRGQKTDVNVWLVIIIIILLVALVYFIYQNEQLKYATGLQLAPYDGSTYKATSPFPDDHNYFASLLSDHYSVWSQAGHSTRDTRIGHLYPRSPGHFTALSEDDPSSGHYRDYSEDHPL
jgi:hypothetical protein